MGRHKNLVKYVLVKDRLSFFCPDNKTMVMLKVPENKLECVLDYLNNTSVSKYSRDALDRLALSDSDLFRLRERELLKRLYELSDDMYNYVNSLIDHDNFVYNNLKSYLLQLETELQSFKGIDGLLGFMISNDLEISFTDRFFYAYKAITADFLDKHTRTISNKVGETVSIDRKDVDADRNNSCSRGLHVGNWKYVKSFANYTDIIVKVKVSFDDAIVVPTSDEGKMRVCAYEVIEIVRDAEVYP